MVMEDSNRYLNAQVVGREFVRQYYTLMNEAPKYLHRFYSSKSSFIHGGDEKPGQEAEPVLGQAEIHKKIESLNFKDCHAKIRQVDSQLTVDKAVVVQVTGELSNQGGPLRRFMQTFVLAQQNPKQYYVHNDIFRYQDEVFQDSYDSEDEMEQRSNEPVQENGLSAHYEHQTATPEVTNQVLTPAAPEQARIEPMPVETSAPPHDTSAAVTDAPLSSGSPSGQARLSPVTNQEPANFEQVPQKMEELNLDTEKEVIAEPEPERAAKPAEAPAAAEPSAAPPAPKNYSWANVVNKTAGGSTAAVAVVPPMNQSTVNSPALPLSVISSQQKMEESVTSIADERPPAAPVNQPPPRSNRSSAEPGGNKRPLPPRGSGGDESYAERRNERYPDAHQVFVGNLPLDIAELELRKFFNGYGKVVECRINRGLPNSKVPFGFVVFDNEEPVKQLLGLKRVEMNGHRLNVEEKKARGDRTGSSGRDRAPRGQRINRAGSKPKDRENSGTRHDKSHNSGGGGGKGGYGSGGPRRM